MVSQDSQRFLSLCIQCAILAIVAFAFYPGIGIHSYTADDFIFLAQVMEHGLAESALIPFADHFIPLYRLLMGGLHLLFETAIPIRIVSLGFHLLNICLVFYIVHNHTRSSLLSAIASLTFGFSLWDATDILRCVNGHWAMGLFFVLTMAVCFEKFCDSGNSSEDSSGPDAAGYSPPMPGHPDEWNDPPSLKYYFAGLASFAIGLGIFTNVLFGGAAVWLLAYIRLLLRKTTARTLRYQLKVVLPFISIVAVYLLLRHYFIKMYFSIQNPLFQMVKASDSLTFYEKVVALTDLPLEFFLNTLKQLSPYFPQYGILFLVFLALLLGKDLAFRRRETYAAATWLSFSLATFLIAAARDAVLYVTLPGPINPAMPSRYLYYPLAGISIALGLLLQPPPSWEDRVKRASARAHIVLVVIVALLLSLLNYGKARDIRHQALRFRTENLRLHQVVTQYRSSMTEFLSSPDYSPDREYHFKLAPAVDAREYPSGYAVMQSDIFHMYFPHISNVRFTYPQERGAGVYMWNPGAVTHP